MEEITKVGVGLYIINPQKELLLGLRKSSHGQNTWCPPGGHLEFGETPEQAAVRECQEETGIRFSPSSLSLQGAISDLFSESRKHYITLHFSVLHNGIEPQILEPQKWTCWQWFSLQSLPPNLFLSSANFLQEHSLVLS